MFWLNKKNVPNLDASSKLKAEKKAVSKKAEQHNLCKQKHSKIQQQLEEKVDKLGQKQQYEVIVHVSCDKKEIANFKKILGKSFEPLKEFKYINAFTCRLTAKQIKLLNQYHDVDFIEENSTIHMKLDNADRWFATEKAREDFNLTGTGTTIAIIDTGVDSNHMDLSGNKVIGWRDFVNGRTTPYDDQGHGTHVASIAAGTGAADSNYNGVAPGASIVGVKVLDQNGSGSLTQIVEAMEWIIDQREQFNIRVANLSLGSDGSSDGQDALSQVVNVAVNHGIAVIVAAGNSGPNRYTVGTPAAAERAITVGSMADVGEGGYFLAPFSSRGPTADNRIKPDIVAPGYEITAAEANTRSSYVTYSGTSMAAPYVAGVAALIIEANPELTPQQVKNILTKTAQEWGSENKDIDYGAGRLQGYQAVMMAVNTRGSESPSPNHISKMGTLQNRSKDVWQYRINDVTYPVAITMIQENERTDFDLYIYDQNGNLIDYAYSTARQETVSFTPSQTGDYFIEVYSYRGRGNYVLDISGG